MHVHCSHARMQFKIVENVINLMSENSHARLAGNLSIVFKNEIS